MKRFSLPPATFNVTVLVAMAIVALSVTAVFPLFRPALPCSDDAAFHLFRLTQLDTLLRDGVVYSRWAPDMAQGYGLPFFNFYAPLSYYLAELFSLVADNLNQAVRYTFVWSIIASGWAAYRLARDYFGRWPALVAAVAYMYAPYQGYDVYFRGNLAEAAAWPLLPLALWTMGRVVQRQTWGWLAATSVAYAAVLLTHNVFALIFSPLLAAYALFQVNATEPFPRNATGSTEDREKRPLRMLRLPVGALALGLALSAFFWLPAMAERELVHSDRLLVPPVFVYWNNFVTLGEIFAPPRPLEPNLLNPSPPRALGLAAGLLALPGLAGIARGLRREQRWQTAFFGAALAVYLFMMTAVSEPIWDVLPLIEFVQFPWRLLGPAALCLAMPIAATIELIPTGRFRSLVAGGAMVLLILSHLFWFHPRLCPGLDNPTVAAMQAYERDTGTVGTTARGEYLPRTVEVMPAEPATAFLTTDQLPPTASLIQVERDGLRHTAVLTTPQTITITANIFAYPGWAVVVNGRSAPITPAPETGLITFPISAGWSEVVVAFTETPLRLTADALSLAALSIIAGLILLAWRKDGFPSNPVVKAKPAFFNAATLLGFSVLATAVFVLPLAPNPLYRETPSVTSMATDFNNGMRLLHVERDPATMPADGQYRVALTWTVFRTPDRRYQTNLTLVDENGRRWSPKGTTNPRVFRGPPGTVHWDPGEYAHDVQLVEALPGTPPGDYRLQLTVFDRETEALVPVAGGAPELTLGQLTLTRPTIPATVAEIAPQFRTDAGGGALRLLGYNLDRHEAVPGDPFLLTLFWQANEEIAEEYVAQLHLLDAKENVVLERVLSPATADFPTTQWQAGDVWRGQHALHLPAELEDGTHRWQLQWCQVQNDSCLTLTKPVDLGTLSITAPDRTFTAPALDVTLAAPLGETATLLGANLGANALSPGEALPVSLVWRAEAETAVSYRVFLHLLGPDGTLVTQSDGEPAGWTRPTTGWLPGEIIVDERTLPLPAELPPGTYTLVAGLYDPATSQRLSLPDGETAVTITSFTHKIEIGD